MSKFFRSPNSSESSCSSDASSSEDEVDETQGKALAPVDFPGQVDNISSSGKQDLSHSSAVSLESITLDRRESGPTFHRDFLLHALLEERCMNEVLRERGANGVRRTSHDEREIQEEAQIRYKKLCAKLAPMNLVSTGLDHERHRPARQKYRDGLNILRKGSITTASRQNGMVAPVRKLLTDGHAGPAYQSEKPGLQSSVPEILDVFAPTHQLFVPSQYLRDFEELGVLGKGGYGKVFHVKHRLDGLPYAVKKVPIRQSVISRIRAPDGHNALEEMLTELRTLAKLDHPNVVRYFNSWIEWSTDISSISTSDDALSGTGTSDRNGFGKLGDGFNSSSSLHRVVTQTDPHGDIGIEFESHSLQSTWQPTVQPASYSQPHLESGGISESATDGAIWSSGSPTLSLHMQMAVYPMTLQNFITPVPTLGSVLPLSHCFHPEPSIAILLAIIDGVDYLHSEGIIHRDLKPANIFLGLENNPRSSVGCVDLSRCSGCRAEKKTNVTALSIRIGDFGLVTSIAQSDSDALPKPAVGTEIYRPAGGKSNISPRLDIFSLGIIAFELMWRFDTQMERRKTLQDLKNGVYPSGFSNFAGEQEAELKGCIDAMLSDNPLDMSHSFDDLKARLSMLLNNK